ncbi:MAG: class I SAM-dependent methyltransferase [Kineosporiaceae bacterium]
MSFDVTAQAYGRFMGRFSQPLAPRFADFAGVRRGLSALDVGCGTGALTDVLVDRLGAAAVCAIDPSPSFVIAARGRFPGLDIREGRAEDLPFADAAVDLALAQLVVHFMADPVAGLAEMARVTRPGGVVAATVWDHASGRGPLGAFWAAARSVTPDVADESHLPGVREGDLEDLFARAGLPDADGAGLTVEVRHASFEDWWQPFTLGVGPAGAHVASLSEADRDRLRDRCRAALPQGPFTTRAVAWAARARRSR